MIDTSCGAVMVVLVGVVVSSLVAVFSIVWWIRCLVVALGFLV